MNKQNKPTLPKEGSKTEYILKYLLEVNPSAKYKSIKHASEVLSGSAGVHIKRRLIGSVILRYNEGLYMINGKTCEDTGHLNILANGDDEVVNNDGQPQPNEPIDAVIDEEVSSEQDVRTFKEICVAEGIDPSDAAGGWVKTKNLSVRIKTSQDVEEELNNLLEAAQKLIESDFWHVAPKPKAKGKNVGVVHISDLHLGAWVKGLAKTPDFDKEVLKQKLLSVVDTVNDLGYAEVHVNFYGDLIEGFGSNHPNSWKEMENGIHGVEAIKLAHKLFTEFFLDRINNLKRVNMVGGNHDRTTECNKSDTKGGVADLVCEMMRLSGYDVTFSPLVVPVEIDGIMYIMLHGDKGVSKRSTSDIICSYGRLKKPVLVDGEIVEEPMFNFVLEGHLHSRIQRMSASAIDKMQLVTDDSIDMRRQVLPSIFTGNSYSEDNNWFSNSGVVITHNNGKGIPCVLDMPI